MTESTNFTYTKEDIEFIDQCAEQVNEEYPEGLDYKDFASEMSDKLSMGHINLPSEAFDGGACPRAWWEWYGSLPDLEEFERTM